MSGRLHVKTYTSLKPKIPIISSLSHIHLNVFIFYFAFFLLFKLSPAKTSPQQGKQKNSHFALKCQNSQYLSCHRFAKYALPKNIILESCRLVFVVYVEDIMDLRLRCTWEKKEFYGQSSPRYCELAVNEVYSKTRQILKFYYIQTIYISKRYPNMN